MEIPVELIDAILGERVLDHPYINDGIRHISVKDTGKEYVLVDGEWKEQDES